MHVTKYPQSCLKVEADGRAILFDLGQPATTKYQLGDFGKYDAVIYTHRHADHLDIDAAKRLHAAGTPLYGNADVAAAVGGGMVEVVGDGEELVIAGFKLKSYALEHCQMVNGSAGVPNNGYMINDQLLLPGDSTEVGSLRAYAAALPIFGPDISLHDAYQAAERLSAEVVIPVHYDVAEMNPAIFERLGGRFNPAFQIKVVADGHSVKLGTS